MVGHKKKILAVEDSSDYQHILQSLLHSDYDLTIAGTADETFLAVEKQDFDLILLDIVLPDSDGYEICSQLRSKGKTKNIPIIFVTSKESIPDKVMGFSLGGDDYVTKPFNALELKARVAAKVRLSDQKESSKDLLCGPLQINIPTQRVYLLGADPSEKESIDVTSTEFRLLLYMAQHIDHVLARDQILEAVWGETLNVTERTVDTHVSKLRKKLKTAGEMIKSVHGAGYRFSLPKINKRAA